MEVIFEYFHPADRKTCPHCEDKTEVFVWWTKIKTRWVTVETFCKHCFPFYVERPIYNRANYSSYEFRFLPKVEGFQLPDWLKAPDPNKARSLSMSSLEKINDRIRLREAKESFKREKYNLYSRKRNRSLKEVASSQDSFLRYISRFDKK